MSKVLKINLAVMLLASLAMPVYVAATPKVLLPLFGPDNINKNIVKPIVAEPILPANKAANEPITKQDGGKNTQVFDEEDNSEEINSKESELAQSLKAHKDDTTKALITLAKKLQNLRNEFSKSSSKSSGNTFADFFNLADKDLEPRIKDLEKNLLSSSDLLSRLRIVLGDAVVTRALAGNLLPNDLVHVSSLLNGTDQAKKTAALDLVRMGKLLKNMNRRYAPDGTKPATTDATRELDDLYNESLGTLNKKLSDAIDGGHIIDGTAQKITAKGLANLHRTFTPVWELTGLPSALDGTIGADWLTTVPLAQIDHAPFKINFYIGGGDATRTVDNFGPNSTLVSTRLTKQILDDVADGRWDHVLRAYPQLAFEYGCVFALGLIHVSKNLAAAQLSANGSEAAFAQGANVTANGLARLKELVQKLTGKSTDAIANVANILGLADEAALGTITSSNNGGPFLASGVENAAAGLAAAHPMYKPGGAVHEALKRILTAA